jgi:predicted dienelactone hydrolase
MPVLLVAGGHDLCIPAEHSVRAHALLPGSRLEVFADAGHFPHAAHPDEFAAVLLDFLDSTTAARTDASAMRRRLLARRTATARPLSAVEDPTA